VRYLVNLTSLPARNYWGSNYYGSPPTQFWRGPIENNASIEQMWLTKACIQVTVNTLWTVIFFSYSAALLQTRYSSALLDGWRGEHFYLSLSSQSESTVSTQIYNSQSSNNSMLCISSYWHIQQFDTMHSQLLTLSLNNLQIYNFLPSRSIAPAGQGLHIVEASWSNSDTPQSVNSSGWVINSSQRPLPDNSQH